MQILLNPFFMSIFSGSFQFIFLFVMCPSFVLLLRRQFSNENASRSSEAAKARKATEATSSPLPHLRPQSRMSEAELDIVFLTSGGHSALSVTPPPRALGTTLSCGEIDGLSAARQRKKAPRDEFRGWESGVGLRRGVKCPSTCAQFWPRITGREAAVRENWRRSAVRGEFCSLNAEKSSGRPVRIETLRAGL